VNVVNVSEGLFFRPESAILSFAFLLSAGVRRRRSQRSLPPQVLAHTG
jgi:hypothetical protein